MVKTITLMGYEICVDEVTQISLTAKQLVINTINPHSYVIAKADKFFSKALHDSDILLPDGSGIVLAAKQILKKNIQKITGSDLHIYLLRELNKTGGSVYFMGASQQTLAIIHKRLQEEYPKIRVGSYSPPFKPKFSEEENNKIILKVNSFNPDVLFIGMTAPKQEKWLHANKNKMNFKIAASIGAVFDYYAGTVVRPSQFWLDLHLEWFPRFLKEPKRLWKRNFVSTPLFLIDMMLYKTGVKK